jgi:hypothetical protein
MANNHYDEAAEFAWRRPAPVARRAAMTLYSWQPPSITYFAALAAAAPFIIAAFFAPALLSLSPTVEMIAPIADARAAWAGEIPIEHTSAPFYLATLTVGDMFATSPGRIHLIAKALSALLVVAPMAYFAVSRLPVFAGATLTAALAGFVASPFGGPAEFALALFLVTGFCFLSASADDSPGRARFEGLLAGVSLFVLWLLNPVFSLASFVALSACPFLSGPRGLTRYAATFFVFAICAGLAELAAPGVNMARADAASGTLAMSIRFTGGESALGLGGVAISALLVLLMTAIFGGREHLRGALTAFLFGVAAFAAARFAGANTLPVFVFAATIAAFSVSSPFYDGLFRNHDRASVAVALAAAVLPICWTAAMVVHAAGQFSLQHQTAQRAPQNIRTELALVQPGGPMIARWIEEGRFSTPEARELLALAPVDQSAMLLEAASRARAMAARGHGVAILAGVDAACVLAEERACRADSNDAAASANVVFVPRLDIGPGAIDAKGRAEALLYTEFKMVEETPFWEIWVRRNAAQPGGLIR